MSKDGGPAFPRPASTDEHEGPCNVYQDQQGMTLRDYFAAKALQGLLASFAGVDCRMPEPEKFAADAYAQADAMLKAREK